jgi:hypothetical protein
LRLSSRGASSFSGSILSCLPVLVFGFGGVECVCVPAPRCCPPPPQTQLSQPPTKQPPPPLSHLFSRSSSIE